MSSQAVPFSAQRRHWYSNVTGWVPVHVPVSAVSVPPRRGLYDVAGAGGYGRRAAVVDGGDHDRDHGADVVGAERVGLVVGARDVDAVRAVGLAALPLVLERRARAGPGARVDGQRAAVLGRARDARRGR